MCTSLTLFSLPVSSTQPNFDYHAEVEAFSARLQESFSLELLKTAFVSTCYLRSEEERRRALGLDLETAALNLKDNGDLCVHGQQFTKVRTLMSLMLNNWCDIHIPLLLLFCIGFPKWLVRGQLSQIAWGGCGSCCRPPDRVRGHVLRRTEPRGGGLDDECRVSCSGWNPARNVLRCDWCSGAEQRACASRAFP